FTCRTEEYVMGGRYRESNFHEPTAPSLFGLKFWAILGGSFFISVVSFIALGQLLTRNAAATTEDAARIEIETPASSVRDVRPPNGSSNAPSGNRPGMPAFFPAPESHALRYRWNGGGQFAYEVHIEADKENETDITDGVCFFTAHAERPSPRAPSPNDHKPSATAFVVNASGYLLTCAHVVADAVKLDVSVGNQSYPARVL